MGAYFAAALKTMLPDAVERAGIATVHVLSDATLAGSLGNSRVWLSVESALLEQVTAYAHRLIERLSKHEPHTGVVEISDFDAAIASVGEYADKCAAMHWERQEGGKAFGEKQRAIDQVRLSRVTDDAVNEIGASKQAFASKSGHPQSVASTPAPERVPATPFELKLANDFEVEFLRFHNKWLFPWYQINQSDRVVDVEDFKGGRIHFGGIAFDGQSQQIYWMAVERYLLKQVYEILQVWDAETKTYPARQRHSSLDRTEGLLISFIARVSDDALDTDRRIRGRGTPKTDTPMWAGRAHVTAKAEAIRMAEAHRALFAAQSAPVEKGGAVPTVASNDFRTQASHEAGRALSRLNDAVQGIEAKRAAEGGLKSGPTVKMYAKAMVATLEEYLGYLIAEVATFSAAGVPRSELIEVARDCLASTRTSARANSTITKLERTLGGAAPGKHLDQQCAVFDAHAEAGFARAGLGLPSATAVRAAPRVAVKHDVFLSHASEDKADFADSFAEALRQRGVNVWYDTYKMEWGRSVREQLDEGLASSRFGVVVLSPTFFKKVWTQAELDALLNVETAGGNRLLPILHKLTHPELVQLSPVLSGRFARDTSKATVDELADELAKMCA